MIASLSPAFHVLSLLEQDLADLPVHLGLHIDGVVSLHGADAGQVDRHVLGACGGDRDGHRGRWQGRDGRSRHRRVPDTLHLIQRQRLEIHQATDDQGDDTGQDQNHHALPFSTPPARDLKRVTTSSLRCVALQAIAGQWQKIQRNSAILSEM